MDDTLQKVFKEQAELRGLWTGGKYATHQDLASYFVARSVERFLPVGGRFGFVMPAGALKALQYAGLRSGDWSEPLREINTVDLTWNNPWRLVEVKPDLFPVPSSVIFGIRTDAVASQMPALATNWKGKLTGPPHSCDDARRLLERKAKQVKIATGEGSDYRSRFFQGATFTPRRLLLVEEVKGKTAIGPGLGRRDVQSRITSLDKEPWNAVAPLTGTIEDDFVAKVYLGEHALPFRMLEPELAVIPLVKGQLVAPDSPELDPLDGIRNWWTQASDIWTRHRKDKSPETLAERLDYHGGLSRQVSPTQIRVVYSTSGKNLTAAIVRNSDAFIDHKLYWTSVDSEEEANYLVAILNSESIQEQVAEYQSVGAFGTRDFHKHVFEVPFPIYDSKNKLHKKLANAGRTAETIAASVNIDGMGFKKARSQIRSRIAATVGIPIEAFVADLL